MDIRKFFGVSSKRSSEAGSNDLTVTEKDTLRKDNCLPNSAQRGKRKNLSSFSSVNVSSRRNDSYMGSKSETAVHQISSSDEDSDREVTRGKKKLPELEKSGIISSKANVSSCVAGINTPPSKKARPEFMSPTDFFSCSEEKNCENKKQVNATSNYIKRSLNGHKSKMNSSLSEAIKRESSSPHETFSKTSKPSPVKTPSSAKKACSVEFEVSLIPAKSKKNSAHSEAKKRESSSAQQLPRKISKPSPVEILSPARNALSVESEISSIPAKKNSLETMPIAQEESEKFSTKGRQSSGASYIAYLNREPPKHLGEKSHPPGSPNCLKGFVVVMTGVMDYVEKDEIRQTVERCGGRVTNAISSKTTHLIAGRDAGPVKVAKAKQTGAEVVDELGWFALVESRTDKAIAFSSKKLEDPMDELTCELEAERGAAVATVLNRIEEVPTSKSPEKSYQSFVDEPSARFQTKSVKPKEALMPQKVVNSEMKPQRHEKACLMWVDKYAPKNCKQLIGQQGEKGNVRKLRTWLEKWHEHTSKTKPTFVGGSRWGKVAQEGIGMRAALLSGPPGVGKTTAAHLVAEELGFEVIEMNASDTRSRRSLRDEVTSLLANRTLTAGSRGHILLMDEVDGMAGTEDRGGISELIHLIKVTKVPILCVCNDRSHPKMRSLVNYCFDLRFYKPQPKQVQAVLMSICFKENVRVPARVIEEIVIASNQDIRQSIHSLNLFCAAQIQEGNPHIARKDIKLGPFEAVKKLLVAPEGGNQLDINGRQELFFYDYNAIPLFVQENYLQIIPQNSSKSVCSRNLGHLRKLAAASDAICVGDVVEKLIRSTNGWSLLPTQAMFSTVIPTDAVRGSLHSMINFPRWFGQNSIAGKNARTLLALQTHMSCYLSANKFEIISLYLPLLKNKIVQPLTEEGDSGVKKTVTVMSMYGLERADIDLICDLTMWGGPNREKDPLSLVSSKVKSKLTRALHKDITLPYATDDMIKAGGKKLKKEREKHQDNAGADEDSELISGEHIDENENVMDLAFL